MEPAVNLRMERVCVLQASKARSASNGVPKVHLVRIVLKSVSVLKKDHPCVLQILDSAFVKLADPVSCVTDLVLKVTGVRIVLNSVTVRTMQCVTQSMASVRVLPDTMVNDARRSAS
uniref:Uncharacterized protein n=1 Tax=Cacopsylla melanoneura TaxID=428564 RepID=A0A8D8ZGX6_9HEMI